MPVAGRRGVEDADHEVGGAGEGGPADVLAAGGAGAEAGQQGGGVLPGGPAYGRVDEGGDERGERAAVVGDGGAGGGEFRGEAGAGGGQVGVQAGLGAVGGVVLGVEQGEGGVTAVRGAVLQDVLDLPEVGRVVVEGEAAVAPHGAEVVFVGEQADGAGDLAAQDAAHGPVVGVRHVSPIVRGRSMLTHRNRRH